jgi:hypothetical protein
MLPLSAAAIICYLLPPYTTAICCRHLPLSAASITAAMRSKAAFYPDPIFNPLKVFSEYKIRKHSPE